MCSALGKVFAPGGGCRGLGVAGKVLGADHNTSPGAVIGKAPLRPTQPGPAPPRRLLVLCLGKEMFLKQAFALSRVTVARESPICAVGSTLLSCNRHYRSQPTHGIGRFRHLLPPEPSKKKRDRIRMKEICAGSDHEYGDLNIQMTAYDMCLVEHFAQYVHKLCNRFSIRVNESYAMPTKTMEVMLVQEQGSRQYLDAVLTTHQRVVQISGLSSTFAPVLLEVIQSNQPEGVHLSVKEHTEADFKVRLKARPELEELMAQMS